ncbi:hypothetical protein ORI20_01125 [Mycobacterium sp. CVI_P3]|uniref:Uncharacterized protein n=1 Tax=Mycobacterium pinniadriaticum TaxID=2994102 RepID=A0ABT3S704_9MYCO|nr:hypothetical protein [Mycobacterium pinniadriaticum]MCX2928857.1 hypothetical protein [Mycobacterium pinniadriaticum]MCX2935276.1 hypothetical protein [Mycobacterium pinniadriaticum]
MNLVNQAQRSSSAAVAAIGVVAAMSVSALAAGPLHTSLDGRLAALSSEVSSAIHDVLAAAHTDVHADRTDVVTGRQTIRAGRHQAALAIGASVLTGSFGDGQIAVILDDARTASQDQREANSGSHTDIRETRQGAAGDIRTIIADYYDGSTVEAVKTIIDTARMDNAMTRSAIAASAQENKSIRHATTSDAVAIRQSVRAGEISKQEAAQEIHAGRRSAHTEIADNHAQMAASHQEIKTTRHLAAKDAHKTAHEGRTGE